MSTTDFYTLVKNMRSAQIEYNRFATNNNMIIRNELQEKVDKELKIFFSSHQKLI